MPHHNPLYSSDRDTWAREFAERRKKAEQELEAENPAYIRPDPIAQARQINPAFLQQSIEALANVNRTAADMARVQSKREIDMLIASALGALPGEIFGVASGTPVQTDLNQRAGGLIPAMIQSERDVIAQELRAQEAKAKADIEIEKIGMEAEQHNLAEKDRVTVDTAKAEREAAERKERAVQGRLKEYEGADAAAREEWKDKMYETTQGLQQEYYKAQTLAAEALARSRDAKSTQAATDFGKYWQKHIGLNARRNYYLNNEEAEAVAINELPKIEASMAASAAMLRTTLETLNDPQTSLMAYAEARATQDASILKELTPLLVLQTKDLEETDYLALASEPAILAQLPDGVLENIALGLVTKYPEIATNIQNERRRRLVKPAATPAKKQAPPKDKG